MDQSCNMSINHNHLAELDKEFWRSRNLSTSWRSKEIKHLAPEMPIRNPFSQPLDQFGAMRQDSPHFPTPQPPGAAHCPGPIADLAEELWLRKKILSVGCKGDNAFVSLEPRPTFRKFLELPIEIQEMI